MNFSAYIRPSKADEIKTFLRKDPQIKQKKAKNIKLKRVKRSYSDSHKAYVVRLRYTDRSYNTISHTWKEIYNITGIYPTTAIEIVKKFHQNVN